MSSDEPDTGRPGEAVDGPAEPIEPAERPAETGEQPGTEEPVERRYTLRRAPKYYSFGVTGLMVGVVLGLVVGSLPAAPVLDRQTYTAGSVLGYFVVAFGLVGVLLGLALALLVERRRR